MLLCLAILKAIQHAIFDIVAIVLVHAAAS